MTPTRQTWRVQKRSYRHRRDGAQIGKGRWRRRCVRGQSGCAPLVRRSCSRPSPMQKGRSLRGSLRYPKSAAKVESCVSSHTENPDRRGYSAQTESSAIYLQVPDPNSRHSWADACALPSDRVEKRSSTTPHKGQVDSHYCHNSPGWPPVHPPCREQNRGTNHCTLRYSVAK